MFALFGCLFGCAFFLVGLFSILVRSTDQDKDLDAEGVYQATISAEAIYQLLVHMTTSSKTKDEFMAMANYRTPSSSDFSSLWKDLVAMAHVHFERTKGVTLPLLM